MTNRLIRHPFQIVTLVIILSLVWAIVAHGQTVDAAQAMVRFTARISLFVFSLIFAASSLHKFFRNQYTTELLRNRRQWGISLAYSHTIHLLAIIIFFRLSGNPPPVLSLIFGGLGYVLLYAMAATSNDWSVKKLGAKNWQRLHKIGSSYLWFIFFLTYLKRLLPASVDAPKPGGTKAEFVVGFLVLLGLLALRIAVIVSTKAAKKSKTLSQPEVIS
jgi:methionine sulfoxide reductase heme-binding subunit